MVEEPDTDAVLDLLGDGTVRNILVAANASPASAREIADACDVAPSTVYRHVDDLIDADLLVERTKLEPDGSHHSLYEANVEHVDVEIGDDAFEVQVQTSRTPSERFTQIWNDIRRTE